MEVFKEHFHNFFNYSLDLCTFPASFWIFSHQNDNFTLWNFYGLIFWSIINCRKLSKLLSRVQWAFYIHCLLSSFCRISIWNLSINYSEIRVCKHWSSRWCYLQLALTEQCPLFNRFFTSLLYYFWSDWVHHGSDCINGAEELHYCMLFIYWGFFTDKTNRLLFDGVS